jgi:hypothetical protein
MNGAARDGYERLAQSLEQAGAPKSAEFNLSRISV